MTNPCDYIVDVVDFLQHHWSEKLTIPELAEKFHVGTTKLKKDFKRITTETIHGYQLRMQLHAARRLLNSTELPLELADKLADYYGVSVDYLLCRTNVKKSYPQNT